MFPTQKYFCAVERCQASATVDSKRAAAAEQGDFRAAHSIPIFAFTMVDDRVKAIVARHFPLAGGTYKQPCPESGAMVHLRSVNLGARDLACIGNVTIRVSPMLFLCKVTRDDIDHYGRTVLSEG